MATLQGRIASLNFISFQTTFSTRVASSAALLPSARFKLACPGICQGFSRSVSIAKERVLVYCSAEGGEPESDEVAAKVEKSDWRAFRAKLVKGVANSERGTGETRLWAHPLVEPEAGCLLIAHPSAFSIQQTYFNQAVIFLFSHTEAGSAGLILNRPTDHTLGQMEGFEELMPELASCPLYLGGDVGQNFTHVLHGISDIKDTKEVIPGVYMGGFSSIKDSIKRGESSASDFRWFLRYAGWGPGQLESEVAAGVWYLASTSKEFVLKQCIKLPKPLWREVLETMGDQYVDISRRTYGEL